MNEYDDLSTAPEEWLWHRLGEAEGLSRADLLIELARRAADRGERPRAVALFAEAASVAEANEALRLAAFALRQEGGLRFAASDYPESAAAYARSAEHSRTLGRIDDEAAALWGRADALRALGDWVGAAEAARACRTLAEAERIAELAGDACLIQANALYYLDREAESLIACAAGRDHFRSVGATARVARIDDFALTVRLYLDDLDGALELARNCHVLAVTSRSSGDDAYATRRLADVHLRREEWDAALERAEQARALYREADILIGVARSDVIRARVLRAKGELAAALEVFTEARVLFDSTGADDEATSCDASRAILLHSLQQYREASAVNRQVISSLAGAEEPFLTDLPWAVGRLADNLLAGGEAEAALAVVDQWKSLWEAGEDEGRVSLLRLLEVGSPALSALGRAEEAAQTAGAALDLTTEADVNVRTADLYDIRALWMLESGDARGRQELAHAIALHLAFGSSRRAAELSEYFLPDVESRHEATERSWDFGDNESDKR